MARIDPKLIHLLRRMESDLASAPEPPEASTPEEARAALRADGIDSDAAYQRMRARFAHLIDEAKTTPESQPRQQLEATKATPIAWELTSAMLARVMRWLDSGPALAYRGSGAPTGSRREWGLADVPAPPDELDWLVSNLQRIPEYGLIALELQYVGPSPAPQAPPKITLMLGEETAQLYQQSYIPSTKRLSLEYLGELAANDFALRLEVTRPGEILVRIDPGSGEVRGREVGRGLE